eukprot:7120151-Pyramimonas_sp.AAC.1
MATVRNAPGHGEEGNAASRIWRRAPMAMVGRMRALKRNPDQDCKLVEDRCNTMSNLSAKNVDMGPQ